VNHYPERGSPFSEIAKIVGNQFVAQEPGKLFILLEEGVFPIAVAC
jgi:hypothetical protein